MKELHRDARGLPWLDGMVQDLRQAIRGLRHSPGFALTAIATLAIGIGVNAAVFTVTNAMLFKGFPLVQRNDRLLYMTSFEGCCVSYADYLDWKAQAGSFSDMAIVAGTSVRLADETNGLAKYDATLISSNTFRLVGRQPVLGRDFTPADEAAGAPPVVILRYELWESRFGKDPEIVGRVVRINDLPTTVIGVMPRGFSFPQKLELWMPMVRNPNVLRRDNRQTWCVVGRLADGVTRQSARQEMQAMGKQLAGAYPLDDKDFASIFVQEFPEFMLGRNSTLIYESMWGAVGFVLLIACANLSNLTLARSTGRLREISLRVALGAGRWRIVRQLLVESLVLSSLGGLFGWWIAKGSISAYQLATQRSAWMSWMISDLSMDYSVLGYLIVISIGTGTLFGLTPARQLSKLDVNATLKDGARGASGGERGKRLSAILVVTEMALAVVLLAGAGLMMRSFLNLYTADLGIKTADILTFGPELPNRNRSEDEWVSLYDRIKARLEAIPGVESVAIASQTPMNETRKLPYELDEKESTGPRPLIPAITIGPDYFRTLGATVLTGREFRDSDSATGAPVVIVNQRFASKYWPGENPLGKRLRLFDRKTPKGDDEGPWRTVVGVVSDIAQNEIARPESNDLVYEPYRQRIVGTMRMMARTGIPPSSLAAAIRREIQTIDPEITVWSVATLDQSFKTLYWKSEFYGSLFAIFAAIALLLASFGLYAVIAHSVSQRTQEIGVRIALGGTAGDIRGLVLRQGLLPVGVGLAIGLALSLAVNRLLQAQLVQVSPSDPITLGAVSAALIAAALLGCLIPARRAIRVDPVVALRHD